MASVPLADIATLLGCPPPPGPAVTITGVGTLAEAGPADLSFLGSDRYLDAFDATQAAAVVVDKKVRLRPGASRPLLTVPDSDLAIARVLEFFAPPVPRPPAGVDPSARVDADRPARRGRGGRARSSSSAARSASAAAPSCTPAWYVGDDVTIGEDCQLFPNVVIRERITLGHRVVIHAGSVLGTDGFGYRWDGPRHAKVPQIGTVVVEDDVEIGSCVCIDRAKFSATRIGRGTKIDNLVQIGHNVVIGPHCIIVGQAGLAGSSTLGNGVVLGGQSAVRDHITLGDGAMVAACSAVAEDVDPKTIVSGMPALPHRQTLREQAAFRRLPDLVVQVRKLQEQIEQLKAK